MCHFWAGSFKSQHVCDRASSPIIATHKCPDSSHTKNLGRRVWATMTWKKPSANLEWTCEQEINLYCLK